MRKYYTDIHTLARLLKETGIWSYFSVQLLQQFSGILTCIISIQNKFETRWRFEVVKRIFARFVIQKPLLGIQR